MPLGQDSLHRASCQSMRHLQPLAAQMVALWFADSTLHHNPSLAEFESKVIRTQPAGLNLTFPRTSALAHEDSDGKVRAGNRFEEMDRGPHRAHFHLSRAGSNSNLIVWIRVTVVLPVGGWRPQACHGGGETEVPRPEASAAVAYLQIFWTGGGGSWRVVTGIGGGALPRTVTKTSVVVVAPSSSMTVSMNM